MSIVNSNGIDVDDVFGFGKSKMRSLKTNRRISISRRFTRMFGVNVVEDYNGEALFENFPAYLAFIILAISVISNTMIIPLFIAIPEITVSEFIIKISGYVMHGDFYFKH